MLTCLITFQVSILLHNFSDAEMERASEEKAGIIHLIAMYNRHFSGRPVPVSTPHCAFPPRRDCL